MKILVKSLLVAGLLSCPSVWARGGEFMEKKMAQELNLTQDQIAAVRAIRGKHQLKMEEQKNKWLAAKDDLQKSMQAPKKGADYQKQLMQKFENVRQLKSEMHRTRFQMALEIRELLNNEQIAKFKDMKKPWKKHHRRRGSKD